ncbi:hypothetical protein GCM10010219_37210 [Streptomyces netropsis]|nr:hypothetical protein GCM10010219_37210 [Streptomyces netropsis]
MTFRSVITKSAVVAPGVTGPPSRLGATHSVRRSAAVLHGYIATLEGECAPRYARKILASVSNIFETAIGDKRLVRHPMAPSPRDGPRCRRASGRRGR